MANDNVTYENLLSYLTNHLDSLKHDQRIAMCEVLNLEPTSTNKQIVDAAFDQAIALFPCLYDIRRLIDSMKTKRALTASVNLFVDYRDCIKQLYQEIKSFPKRIQPRENTRFKSSSTTSKKNIAESHADESWWKDYKMVLDLLACSIKKEHQRDLATSMGWGQIMGDLDRNDFIYVILHGTGFYTNIPRGLFNWSYYFKSEYPMVHERIAKFYRDWNGEIKRPVVLLAEDCPFLFSPEVKTKKKH